MSAATTPFTGVQSVPTVRSAARGVSSQSCSSCAFGTPIAELSGPPGALEETRPAARPFRRDGRE